MVIFITTNSINGKKYIGKDKRNNPKYLGSGTIFRKAIKKYGRTNFKKEIIEYCKNVTHLCEREIFWIKHYNATESPDFYNIASGGSGGNLTAGDPQLEKRRVKAILKTKAKWTKKYKEKVYSFTKNKEWRLNHSQRMSGVLNPMFGKAGFKNKKHTPETKEIIGKYHKGKILSSETRQKISQARKKIGSPCRSKYILKNKNSGELKTAFAKEWLNMGVDISFIKRNSKYQSKGWQFVCKAL